MNHDDDETAEASSSTMVEKSGLTVLRYQGFSFLVTYEVDDGYMVYDDFGLLVGSTPYPELTTRLVEGSAKMQRHAAAEDSS